MREYARAVSEFTRSTAPELPRSSFARISSMDLSDLPRRRYLAVDGCRLGYRCYKAPSSSRVLVLVHGSGCFGDLFHQMAKTIAGRDLAQVYTLDMRGHGLSDGERGHAVRHAGDMIADIAAFIEHVKAERPDAHVTLGGHSAGGGVVLAFSRSPMRDLVSSYLFLAPFLGLGSNVNRPHFGGWVKLRGFRLRLLSFLNVLGIKRFNQTTVVDFNVGASGDKRYTSSWSFSTLLAFGPGRWLDKVPPIPSDKPVLVLAGEGDECFAQPLYRDAFQVVAPHAQIPNAGRGGHWDLLVEPRAISELGSWLERLPA